MLTQTQAVAIILEYDTIPASLLTKDQKSSLAAAKDVNKDTASRAVSEFLGHESSKKYLVSHNGPINVVSVIPHHVEKELPVTTIKEFHD